MSKTYGACIESPGRHRIRLIPFRSIENRQLFRWAFGLMSTEFVLYALTRPLVLFTHFSLGLRRVNKADSFKKKMYGDSIDSIDFRRAKTKRPRNKTAVDVKLIIND